jgi:hypothetical protein
LGFPKPTGPEPPGEAERCFQKAIFDASMKLYDASLNSVLWTLKKDPKHAGALYFLGRYSLAGIHGLIAAKGPEYLEHAEKLEPGLAEKYASVFSEFK